MVNSISGTKVAVLVANGFDEISMTGVWRALQGCGASLRTVSPEQHLVVGWSGQDWGSQFAVDMCLNKAQCAEYDALFIPGGYRSHNKLALTAHTRRFVSGFLAGNRPVCMTDDAVGLLCSADLLRGQIVGGPDRLAERCQAAGAQWNGNKVTSAGQVLSGPYNSDYDACLLDMLGLAQSGRVLHAA